MSGEGEPLLKSGSSYLFTERGVPRAYNAFKKLLAEGKRGLVISRSHPQRLQQAYGLDCPVMWIAKSTKPTGGVLSLEPTRLMKIHGTISDFIKANPGSVVLLDGLEYLITENGFAPVMGFHPSEAHAESLRARSGAGASMVGGEVSRDSKVGQTEEGRDLLGR